MSDATGPGGLPGQDGPDLGDVFPDMPRPEPRPRARPADLVKLWRSEAVKQRMWAAATQHPAQRWECQTRAEVYEECAGALEARDAELVTVLFALQYRLPEEIDHEEVHAFTFAMLEAAAPHIAAAKRQRMQVPDLAGELKTRLREAMVARAVAAERKRIRSLAISKDAYYLETVVSEGIPGRPGSAGVYDKVRQFADLLEAP